MGIAFLVGDAANTISPKVTGLSVVNGNAPRDFIIINITKAGHC